MNRAVTAVFLSAAVACAIVPTATPVGASARKQAAVLQRVATYPSPRGVLRATVEEVDGRRPEARADDIHLSPGPHTVSVSLGWEGGSTVQVTFRGAIRFFAEAGSAYKPRGLEFRVGEWSAWIEDKATQATVGSARPRPADATRQRDFGLRETWLLRAAPGLRAADRGDLPGAERLLLAALREMEPVAAPDDGHLALTRIALADIYFAQRKPLAAAPLIRQAVPGLRGTLDDPGESVDLDDLARRDATDPLVPHRVHLRALVARAGIDGAMPLLERALAEAEQSPGGADELGLGLLLARTAMGYVTALEFRKAESRATRALALIEKVLGSDHPALAEPLTALATTHLFEGRPAQAESMARKLLTVIERALGPNHLAVANALMLQVSALRSMRRDAEAAPLDTRLRAIRRGSGRWPE